MKRLLRFLDWPLRAKMAALLVVASLLPLGIATFINIREARERLVANTASLLAARGDQLLGELDTFNRGYQRSVVQVAHLPRVLDFYQARPEDSDRLKAIARTVLEVWPASDSAIRGVALLDSSGTVKIATEDPLIGLNLSYRSDVREALRGVAVISDIHLAESQVGYAPSIAYLAPVFGPDRKPTGVAVFWVRATALWAVMRASNELAGPGSFAVMFDQQGIRIAHTYSEDIVFRPSGRLNPATIDSLVAERRFGEKTRQLLEDVRAFPEQFDRSLSASPDPGLFRGFAPVNQKWNYGVARRFKTVRWTVFYMIPEQSLHAQIAQMAQQKTLFAGLITLVALLAGTLFATLILKPIGSLSTATKLIASGDLAARVRVGHADELGLLGASFNSMSERIEAQARALQRARDELEVRVQERTGELVQTTKNLEVEIVERKHTEAALRESQERIHAVVAAALDGIITMNHEGRIVDFNPAAERIFVYRSSEVIGRALADVIIPPALRERHQRGLAHYLATGEGPVLGRRVELTAVRADGTEFPVELSITRVGSAEPPLFTGFVRDITERKRAEEDLRKSQVRFSAVFRSCPAAMSINTVADGRLIDANEQYCEFFGYSREEIIGRSVLDLNLWANPEERAPMIQRLLKEGAIRGFEVKQRRRSGEVRDVLASLELIELAGESQSVLISMFTDITERKRAEEALRASQQLLRAIIDNSTAVVYVKDLQGRYLLVNRRYGEIFHLTEAAILGKTDHDLFPPAQAEAFRAVDQQVLAAGTVQEAEELAPQDDGLHTYISIKCPLFDEAGKPYAVCGISTDITERKLAEARLERQRAELQLILDTVPALIFYKDAQHRLLRVNQELVRLIGLPKEAIEGKTDEEMNSPHAERYYRDEDEIIASGQAKRGIVEPMEGAMGMRWLQTDKLPYRNEAGQVTGIIGFAVDITERRQAEHKLREQLERLDLLHQITRAIGERQDLHSIFQVVVRTLEEQQPIDFCCMCLYDQAGNGLTVTSVGVRSRDLAMDLAMTEQARVAIDENGLSRCVRGELVYEPDISQVSFPFPQRLARGGLRALVAAPLLVESHVFGVLIAARRQAQSFSSGECEFLRQLSGHVALAAHQAQLYGALQQAYDDLRQTQQAVMQQERLRALGQMASGIAHDINNAISPVALYTESLLEKEPNLSPRARDYLQTIRQAIHDVAETVARMREFYRQREPQLTLTLVHLNRLVQQVMDLTRARWDDMPQQRGMVIQVQTELAPDLPAIMGVESEIREALTNLIFNAVDAMPDGGTLTLRTRIGEGAQGSEGGASLRQVHVEVTDTGVGMDEDTRRRCLEPFFTTKGERGTGLGLAMVYGMIQRHSADLEIESAPGKGTTVRLSFSVPATASAGNVQPYGVCAVRSRLRILVVDDDPLLVKSLRDTLEGDGHAVVTTNGGQEGINAFRAARDSSEPFAVVITDLGMPYVDGRKVSREVKAASPSTPVILLTGWGQRLVAEGDVPPHVDHVLNKPPKLRELREALIHCCPPAGS